MTSTYHELAAAMRKGAALRPQVRGAFFDDVDDVLCSCAFGAAYEGATGHVDLRIGIKEIERIFPVCAGIDWRRCPQCGRYDDTDELITHLNDDHEWTREAIADWLDDLDKGSPHE